MPSTVPKTQSVQETIKVYAPTYYQRRLKFRDHQKKMFHEKKRTLRGPGGKYLSASERTMKVEGGRTMSTLKPEIRKVESDEDKSDIES